GGVGVSVGPLTSASAGGLRHGDVRGRGNFGGFPGGAYRAAAAPQGDGDGGAPGGEVRQGVLQVLGQAHRERGGLGGKRNGSPQVNNQAPDNYAACVRAVGSWV